MVVMGGLSGENRDCTLISRACHHLSRTEGVYWTLRRCAATNLEYGYRLDVRKIQLAQRLKPTVDKTFADATFLSDTLRGARESSEYGRGGIGTKVVWRQTPAHDSHLRILTKLAYRHEHRQMILKTRPLSAVSTDLLRTINGLLAKAIPN